MRIPIRRAVISVFDKAGIEELAAALHGVGCEIVSTGSTATEISEITSFPECLDGRVKTLHPAVHAGILADRRRPEHMRQLAELGVEGFDLVVVNLYPFSRTVASGADYEECIEKIDVGGPSMIRGAAKNHASVAVVTDPSDYARAAEAARRGGFDADERAALAAKAFARTAAYDAAIARWTVSTTSGWPCCPMRPIEAARSEGPMKIPSTPGVAAIALASLTALADSIWTNSDTSSSSARCRYRSTRFHRAPRARAEPTPRTPSGG